MSVTSESTAAKEPLRFKEACLGQLVKDVPGLLDSQDPATGRFGEGIWIVTDQNVMFPLAVAWGTEHSQNPYYHDAALLEALMSAGDALIDDQDEQGRWEFRKKDGSTWGPILMPWIYSRWVRAFGIIRESMPPPRRARWEAALLLGYEGISQTCLESIHNIPTHHAMGLWYAGKVFGRPEWQEQAREFLHQVAAAQAPEGYWSEHQGPVVSYNFVYVDALGAYYGMSGDEGVLEALRRAAKFHAFFTYPTGAKVETVDGRNPYSKGIMAGNVGFTFSAEGRGFLRRQWELAAAAGDSLAPDLTGSLLLYGEEGETEATVAERADGRFVFGPDEALVVRSGPWFVCLSAFVAPIPDNRWGQDRQNLVSVFHDDCGLVLGGGNTKLQPLWSTFSVGDPSLLAHQPGDENPTFEPAGELYHVPSEASIVDDGLATLALQYGPESCRITVEASDDQCLSIRLSSTRSSGLAVSAHLTFIPCLGEELVTEAGHRSVLSEDAVELRADEIGQWLQHHGWRAGVPAAATLTWPVLPHNPYRKDGSATPEEGRLVLTVPLSEAGGEQEVTLRVE